VQTVVETAGFLSEARSLGLPDAERLAIVTWIAANPAAGKSIEGNGRRPQGAVRRKRQGKEWWLPGYHILYGDGHSGFPAQYLCEKRENRFDGERAAYFEIGPGRYCTDLQVRKETAMKKRKPTAGERMIESARQALAFAQGKKDHGCEVHVPDDIDVKAIREKISLSQSEFAKLFGLSKRTLEHWEHGRRVPSGPARAFLTVIAREPDAVRRALIA
jgi:putative transcriptional regulator